MYCVLISYLLSSFIYFIFWFLLGSKSKPKAHWAYFEAWIQAQAGQIRQSPALQQGPNFWPNSRPSQVGTGHCFCPPARVYGRCRGAKTFPTRKRTLEPNFLFSQTSESFFFLILIDFNFYRKMNLFGVRSHLKKIGGDSIDLFSVFQVERETVMTVSM